MAAGLILGGFDLQVLHDVELNADLLLLLLLPALLFEAAARPSKSSTAHSHRA